MLTVELNITALTDDKMQDVLPAGFLRRVLAAACLGELNMQP